MIVIGLTGGIATGKSTVSKMLRDYGLPVIDSDAIAREVVEPGEEVLSRIIREFGEDILLQDGRLNRQKLGNIVFNDKIMLQRLNDITHPEIKRRIKDSIERYKELKTTCLIIDVPLLIESNYKDMVDKILLVYTDRDTQAKRLVKRNGYTRREAMDRINSQMDIDEKLKYADYIIDNTHDLENTRLQLIGFLKELCRVEELDG